MGAKLNVLEDKDEPWFKHGLNFKCTECGQCCTGSPGYVWVGDDEIKLMAEHLKISVSEFARRYLRRVGNRWSLIELAKQNFDCIFLKDKKCQIYSVRPKQCRTFPWWPHHLQSKEAWMAAAEYCEGIRQEAPVVPLETIETQLNIYLGNE